MPPNFYFDTQVLVIYTIHNVGGLLYCIWTDPHIVRYGYFKHMEYGIFCLASEIKEMAFNS